MLDWRGGGSGVVIKRRAFTVVELLIVIGIIAVLMSMLLPVLAKVRDSAQATTCTSNLQQIAAAGQIYAASNDGQLPWAGQDWPYAAFNDVWVLLEPSISTPSYYICPADFQPPWNQWWVSPAGWGGQNGYGGLPLVWPSSYYYVYPCYHRFDDSSGNNLPGKACQMYLRDVKYPSKKALFLCNAGHDGAPGAHGDGVQILFGDGHAAFIPTDEINPGNYYGTTIIHLDYTTYGLAGSDLRQ